MMERMRGRNLRHPGCLIGVTAGLTIGIILGGVLAGVFNVSLDIVLWLWFAFTVGLGLVGWITGARLTEKASPTTEDDSGSGASNMTTEGARGVELATNEQSNDADPAVS